MKSLPLKRRWVLDLELHRELQYNWVRKADFVLGMAYCSICSAPVAGAFCSQCGAAVSPTTSPTATPAVKQKTSPMIWVLAAVGFLALLIVIALIAIPIAVPRLEKGRMLAQETGAIAAIRTIHTAQVLYYSQFGRYATSLAELGPPTSGAADAAAADLIDATLASGFKNGYRFTLAGTRDGTYTIAALPISNEPERRTFYSDQTMAIHEHLGPVPAGADDPVLK
jgi:type IV pilus assembly protein PilA